MRGERTQSVRVCIATNRHRAVAFAREFDFPWLAYCLRFGSPLRRGRAFEGVKQVMSLFKSIGSACSTGLPPSDPPAWVENAATPPGRPKQVLHSLSIRVESASTAPGLPQPLHFLVFAAPYTFGFKAPSVMSIYTHRVRAMHFRTSL